MPGLPGEMGLEGEPVSVEDSVYVIVSLRS